MSSILPALENALHHVIRCNFRSLISAFAAKQPKTTDEVTSFSFEKETEGLIQRRADEHALTLEQMVRAFPYCIVSCEPDAGKQWREASMPWKFHPNAR